MPHRYDITEERSTKALNNAQRRFNEMSVEERHEHWIETSTKVKRDVDGSLLIHCTGMTVRGQHWAPPEEFNRNPTKRKEHRFLAGCNKCRADYQALRHVKVSQRESLSAVGIELQLVDGEGAFVCSVCELPIGADDKVHIEGSIAHASCTEVSDES